MSLKTGGCPEDCHFCAQSGRFDTPVLAGRLDIPSLVDAARQRAQSGAVEFCVVAAVRGHDERLMAAVRAGVQAIRQVVDIDVACSLGILTRAWADELAALGVHRYSHNLETARSYFPEVVTTHTWGRAGRPCGSCARTGWRCAAARSWCCASPAGAS